MNKQMHISIYLFIIISFSCTEHNFFFTEFVDPFIGTAGTGHTFPGATLPFGMVQLSPDTRKDGWQNCSGYHSSNPTILGFSHTHLSGTGAIDYGDILLYQLRVKYNLIQALKNNLKMDIVLCLIKKQSLPNLVITVFH